MNRQILRLIAPCLIVPLALALAAPALAQGGSIDGKVTLSGTPPRKKLIRMGADPNCLKINAGKKVFFETVVADENGGLANVFVHIKGDVGSSAPPSAPAVIEQNGCKYEPHVVGLVVGQKLRVVNNDETLHNIHSGSELKGNEFNVSQPRAGMTRDFDLKDKEVMMRIKCDVHNWMEGFVGVMSHAYFAVSDAGGGFKLPDGIPAGKYTVEAWHEFYGAKTQEVEVKAGETVTVAFDYSGEERAASHPGLEIRDLRLPSPHEGPREAAR